MTELSTELSTGEKLILETQRAILAALSKLAYTNPKAVFAIVNKATVRLDEVLGAEIKANGNPQPQDPDKLEEF